MIKATPPIRCSSRRAPASQVIIHVLTDASNCITEQRLECLGYCVFDVFEDKEDSIHY